MTETLWLLIVAGGPLLLAILLGYALVQRRQRSTGEKAAQRAAIRRNYEGDDAPHPARETPAARSFRKEREADDGKSELEEGLVDTFPASDPVSATTTVTTGAPPETDPVRGRRAGARQ